MNILAQGDTGGEKEIRELRFHFYCFTNSFDGRTLNTLRSQESCKGSALGCRNGLHSELFEPPGAWPAPKDTIQKVLICLNALRMSSLSGNHLFSLCLKRQKRSTEVLASKPHRQRDMHVSSALSDFL